MEEYKMEEYKMEEYKMEEYNTRIDEAIFNELLKDYQLKELPKEVSIQLEIILLSLMNNVNNPESDRLRREFVVAIAPYSHGSKPEELWNTGEFWERYELILRDLHKVDVLTRKDKDWYSINREAEKIIKKYK